MTISVPEAKAIHLLDVLQHLTYVTVETVSPNVHTTVRKPRRKFPKNPDNPSPSGDPYWDNPANLRMLDEAVKDLEEIRAGRQKTVTVKDNPKLQAIFAWANQQ
jgi:hypothetical protein